MNEPVKMLKPMLYPSKIPQKEDLRFPLLVSEKLDGMRVVVQPSGALSRRGKPLPNVHLEEFLQGAAEYSKAHDVVLDGEIFSRTVPFNRLMGILRSFSQPLPADLKYYVFDCVRWGEWIGEASLVGFADRLEQIRYCRIDNTRGLVQHLVHSWEELLERLEKVLAQGGEGLIARSPLGIYKHGRCTFLEHNGFKIKVADRYEGVVVGFKEKVGIRAGAPRTLDPLGDPEKVHKQADLEPKGTLGSLLVRWVDKQGTSHDLRVGSGFSDEVRDKIWNNQVHYFGRFLWFKGTMVGALHVPRFPIFDGWTEEEKGG